MARHDGKRTGAALGASDITKPVAYWRSYLGGALNGDQLAIADIDKDGQDDLLFASSGRIVAKHEDDSTIWVTKPLGILSIVGIADLDGDGTLDVIANATDKVVVLSSLTGALLWAEPDGELGTLGRTLVGDLDGDGKPEILVLECGCCGVNSGKTGYVRSFAAGFASPTLLWTLPGVACGGADAITLVDMDGDGHLEVLFGLYDHFELLRGNDGLLLAKTMTPATWVTRSFCYPVNVDGVAGDELVCLLSSPLPPATDQQKAFLLKFDGTSVLAQPWKLVLAPDGSGKTTVSDPVADLDGDGKPELILSGYDPVNGGWHTHVVDALTGTELITPIAGHSVVGAAALEATDRKVLLTATGTSLVGWTFQRLPTATLTSRWVLSDQAALSTLSVVRNMQGGYPSELIRRDLDGDGLDEILVRSTSGTATVSAFSAASGAPTLRGDDKLNNGADVVGLRPLPAVNLSQPQFALTRTDGILNLLDKNLNVATTGGEFATVLGIHVGGYYAAGAWGHLREAARSYPLDSTSKDAIVVGDSRGALLRLDAANASLAVHPKLIWEQLGHSGPTIIPGLAGSAVGIACFKHSGANWAVAALSADGTEAWSTPIENNPFSDLAPATLDTDSNTDLVAQWGDPNDVILHTRGISGLDGTKLWDAVPVSPGSGRGVGGVAIASWNGDASDDVINVGPVIQVLSGTDGTVVMQGTDALAYGMTTPLDVNADGTEELLLQGTFYPVHLYTHALTTLWTSADDDRPYPYGAVASCPSGLVLAEGSLQHPARMKLTKLSDGSFATQVLAAGQVFVDEAAATAAGAYMGQLTSAVAHTNLTGKGRPTVLFGSSDGYLYGINLCDGTLDFSKSLGVAVGEATFADTDGDGRDEILVGAADGYLYGLKNEVIVAPSIVTDLDPDLPGQSDVDRINSTTHMAASWTAVAGATGYQAMVATDSGEAITVWTNVGSVTETTIEGLSLSVGARYVFVVRAISGAGPSVDTASNGVIVAGTAGGSDAGAGTDGGPAPDRTGGCGCQVGQGSGSGLASGLSVLALWLTFLFARRAAGARWRPHGP